MKMASQVTRHPLCNMEMAIEVTRHPLCNTEMANEVTRHSSTPRSGQSGDSERQKKNASDACDHPV